VQIAKAVRDSFKQKYGASHPQRLEILMRADLSASATTQLLQDADKDIANAEADEQRLITELETKRIAKEEAQQRKQAALEAKAQLKVVNDYLQPVLASERQQARTAIKPLLKNKKLIEARRMADALASGLTIKSGTPVLGEELFNESAAELASEDTERSEIR
jgi:hypothetical protein